MLRWNVSPSPKIRDNSNQHPSSAPKGWRRHMPLLQTLVTRHKVVIFKFVTTIFILKIAIWSQSTIPSSPAAIRSPSVAGDNLLFACPVGPKSMAANDNEATGLIAEFYNETNGERNSKGNKTIAELTNTAYDGWGHSFNENKKLFYKWKAEQFSTLRSGDIIYESACGEGFNLAMSLQIMKDAGKIDHVSVYGNDYIEKSVKVAHNVLEKLAPPGTKVRSLCQGDSTNLYFVPSDSFDLAYTGYIDPIVDPYGIYKSDNEKDLCKAKKENSDWAKAKLVDIDQAAQEDWFAKWVSELVRIVKPGRSILIENVGLPVCDDLHDWGGVSREWWKLAVSKYKWDIDVDSILTKGIRPDKNVGRYHVSMRKNAKAI